ncbi:MAG: four-carbon acid sugar kinase family protein, partial [Planctomycetota bacterium]
MKTPLLGCIADDFTGATDLASMLVRAGLRVIQCFGLPDDLDSLRDADAIVVSLKSRSIPPNEAVSLSLKALNVLRELRVQRYFFKYCSTFDSTEQGNIGPVADVLAAELDNATTLFCPSFPENGRTVYCGHLFVHGIPLHESGMRNHPINPMTDSNLVRVLQTQSDRKVSVWKLNDPPPTSTSQHVIADAISEEDMARVARRPGPYLL